MPSSQTAKEIEDSECEMFAEADSNVTVPENTSSTGGPFSGWKQQSLPDARFDELCSEFHADIDSSHEEATLLASLTDRSQGFDFRHAYGALRNRSPRWQEELSPGMYFDGCYDLSASDHQDNCNGHRKGHQNDCSFHNGMWASHAYFTHLRTTSSHVFEQHVYTHHSCLRVCNPYNIGAYSCKYLV